MTNTATTNVVVPILNSTPERMAEVYLWVSSLFDQLGIVVDCGGNIHNPHYDAVSLDNALIILDSGRDKPLKPFGIGVVRAATSQVIDQRRRDALATLKDRISTRHAVEPREVVKRRLIDVMTLGLDPSSRYTPDDAARLIAKTIWQVKRKMAGMPVTDHTMLVFVGPQKGGKSTLVQAITEPVRGVTAGTNLQEITDNRNVQLFRNYVGTLEELDRADRTCVESLKRVITEAVMTRRVLGTNKTVNIAQSLTLIGTSNRSIGEVIIDETGNRRFIELNVIGKQSPNCEAFWAAAASLDWLSVWRMVDEHDADPTREIMDRIASAQSAERSRSAIETWLQHAREQGAKLTDEGQVTTTNDLYRAFRDWEATYAATTTGVVTFNRALKRLAAHGTIPYEPYRTNAERGYRCIGAIDVGDDPIVDSPNVVKFRTALTTQLRGGE